MNAGLGGQVRVWMSKPHLCLVVNTLQSSGRAGPCAPHRSHSQAAGHPSLPSGSARLRCCL